jgi:periplasmic divalent cation tolerance protein
VTALLCYCACPDRATADRIARALVEERLAACVNVVPGIGSTYRWKGVVEQADEVLLIIKTVRARLTAVGDRLAALHPYELPELVAVEAVGGLPGYLGWLAEQTQPGD